MHVIQHGWTTNGRREGSAASVCGCKKGRVAAPRPERPAVLRPHRNRKAFSSVSVHWTERSSPYSIAYRPHRYTEEATTERDMANAEEHLMDWLRDAHAAEQQAETMLNGMANRI